MKRKTLTLLLALTLIIASITPIQKASAAAKLSKTSITLYVGKTTTIKLTGGNAKWSVKNSKIKILKKTKKSAKIKAMNKGTTYLYAKVGKKKLKCKVVCNVKNVEITSDNNVSKFNAKQAEKNISKEVFRLNGYIYVKLKSNYNVPTAIDVKCNFCDSSGQVIDYDSDYSPCLVKGKTTYVIFEDSPKSYTKTDISYVYSVSDWNSIIQDVTLTSKFIKGNTYYDDYYEEYVTDDSYIMATVTNGSKKELYNSKVFIIYYDSTNKVVAIDYCYFGDIPAGMSDNKKIYEPSDVNYNKIPFDHYDCFLAYAYY